MEDIIIKNLFNVFKAFDIYLKATPVELYSAKSLQSWCCDEQEVVSRRSLSCA
jgi:hypothetical protein